jgi:hypothetical protein
MKHTERSLIYAAETAAFAVLEVRVHLDLDWDMLPDDYVLVAIDAATIVAETIHELPDDPRATGDPWIESRGFARLRVPSWIVPESYARRQLRLPARCRKLSRLCSGGPRFSWPVHFFSVPSDLFLASLAACF